MLLPSILTPAALELISLAISRPITSMMPLTGIPALLTLSGLRMSCPAPLGVRVPSIEKGRGIPLCMVPDMVTLPSLLAILRSLKGLPS
ncbi:hypothetical protein D3C87_1813770 [compost metagenome]